MALAAEFYDRPVVEVARDLVGCTLAHGRTAGVIVETEAYHESEPACHAYVGAAVLIRALEPISALDAMRERRGLHAVEQLCSGPGKLTRALAIELEQNATDLARGPVRIGPRPPGWEDVGVVSGTRIGITKAAELEWRFCATGSRSVSRPWPAGLRRAA